MMGVLRGSDFAEEKEDWALQETVCCCPSSRDSGNEPEKAQAMNRFRILLVDHDPKGIRMLRSAFEPQHECYWVLEGDQTLTAIEQGTPDLVLCDCDRLGLNSQSLLRQVRQRTDWSRLPVIFCSSPRSRADLQEVYRLGVDLVLTKPIEPGRMRRNIDRFIQDHRLRPKQQTVPIEKVQREDVLVPPPASSPAAPPSDHPNGEHSAVRSSQAGRSGGPAATRHPEGQNRVRSQRSQHVRVLVVEDDADALEMIRAALADQFDVLMAEDGLKAVDLANRYKPDIFIIDGLLPRLSGFQLTRLLRNRAEHRAAPIIFISGRNSQRDQRYARQLGVDQFLAKPFTVQRLLQEMHQIIQRPGFKIRTDRLDSGQIYLEQFHETEIHRKGRRISLDHYEHRGVVLPRKPGSGSRRK